MSKNLLIVESPGKIKKIQGFLGSDFIVTASRGHIMDLESSGLALDPDNNFEPTYEIYKDKKSVVSDLKKSCAGCNSKDGGKIYLAADEDREGEFIAESIKRVLKLKNSNYSRVVFHEITKKAILNAIANPRKIDENLVHAQQTRRFLDRIVGYKLSPLLSRIPDLANSVNRYKLGAGRVQSVIVKIIVDKEHEIQNFTNLLKSAFYEGKGLFELNIKSQLINLQTLLYSTEPKISKFELLKSSDEVYDQVIELMNKLKDCSWKLVDIKKRNISRSPTAPFITSSLQRESSTKLGWPIAKTMQVAQKLYEGGHITYMRTDCTVLSDEAHNKIKSFVTEQYGTEYYTFKQYTSKSANAQEAHEAIRPTDFTKLKISQDDSNSSLTEQDKLYKLIWKKTVASQMSKAQIESTQLFLAPVLKINSKSQVLKYLMAGSVSRIIFDGYLKLYRDLDNDEELVTIDIPSDYSQVSIKPIQIKIKESVNSPPPRYNESSLVECLEKQGIGRPSTYAAMVGKIQDKDFVRSENVPGKEITLKELLYDYVKSNLSVNDTKMFLGKENKRLVPTQTGIISTRFLVSNFPQIMDVGFTASMEKSLDEISNGKLEYIQVLRSYYDIITGQIQGFLKTIPTIPASIPESIPESSTELVGDSQVIPTKNLMPIYINNNVVGSHPETGQEIVFTKTKFGYAIKMFNPEAGKDIWANIKEKPSLEQAVELFKPKLHPELVEANTQPNPESKSTVIKVIGKYQIKSGPYGPYIQTGSGKNVKFTKIPKSTKPEEITTEECKKLCGVVKTKKTTKKISQLNEV